MSFASLPRCRDDGTDVPGLLEPGLLKEMQELLFRMPTSMWSKKTVAFHLPSECVGDLLKLELARMRGAEEIDVGMRAM